MKKTLFLVISVFLFFIGLNQAAFATSGACSWHGGVNCAAGADWDGSVICNDGWRDSSVSFYSMSACSPTKPSCTLSELESLRQKYGVSEIEAQIEADSLKIFDLQAQINALEAEKQLAISAERDRQASMSFIEARIAQIESEYDMKISPLLLDIELLRFTLEMNKSQLDYLNSAIDSECWALGYDRQWQQELDTLEAQLKSLEELQASSCPPNSTYKNGECFCNEGYISVSGICITYTQNCQLKYGDNSYGDKNSCYCKDGYEWNSIKTSCVKSVVCPVNSSKLNNVCFCNDGYEWNSLKTECIKSVVCPQNSSKMGGQCVCNNGYKWDISGTACVKEEPVPAQAQEPPIDSEQKEEAVEEKIAGEETNETDEAGIKMNNIFLMLLRVSFLIFFI